MFRAARITGPGVPVNLHTAFRAAPFFFLFGKPLFNTDIMHVSEVFQDLGMMAHSVIVKVRVLVAGEVRTIGTAGHARPFFRAQSHAAITAIRRETASGKTSVALDLLFGYLPAFGGLL